MSTLKQCLIENLYSKQKIRAIVRSSIIEAYEESSIEEKMNKAMDLIDEYTQKTYSYDSKNRRIRNLLMSEKFTPENVLMDILTVVMPVQGNQTIQTVVAIVAPNLGMEDDFEAVKCAAEMIAVACESDLYDLIAPNNSETGTLMICGNYELPEDVMQDIADRIYIPPLITEPMEVTNNFQSAYHTFDDHVVLKSHNRHNEPQALDVLNISNNTAMSLDEHILSYEEESKKPLDTPEKIRNFQRMASASRKVYDMILSNGNRFFQAHKYCSRGREYDQGYHVNIQAGGYKRALVNFHRKEVVELD